MEEKEIKQQINKINKDLKIQINNLIYLLKNINIEYINLYSAYKEINNLIILRRSLELELKEKKIYKD